MDIKQMLGCVKSPVSQEDYLIDTFLLDVRDEGQYISYRDEMPPVVSQGKKGSCVGHAYYYVKKWQEFKEKSKYIELSRQWIYEKAREDSGHAEGTTMVAGAKVLRKLGVPLDEYWPYTDDKANPGKPKEGAENNALIYRVNDTVYLRITSPAQFRQVLLKFGPTAIGVKVYKNWYRQKDGHIPTSTICERAEGVLGGHAICFIEHNPQTKEWSFENSWGPEWGEQGFGYITEVEMKKIFMDGFALLDIPNKDLPGVRRVKDLPVKEQAKIWRS